MTLIECVPNFSEGRDLAVVTAIRDAIAEVDGISVLHMTADASHNRSVITFVGPKDTIVDAAFAAIRTAREHIDLSAHAGVHPRMGAADVIPFIPLNGATMDDCIDAARALGERVGRELEIPVYLYEHAATRPERRNLADVRRGGFEVIRNEIVANEGRIPDFGPRRIHPTAGAVAIGARPFLIAFNVFIGGADKLPVAKQIASVIRAANGGLPGVKALGLEVDGQAQVSMNLVDITQTSLVTAFDAVSREAELRGTAVTWSEIIGLVPDEHLLGAASAYLKLRDAADDHLLRRRILEHRGTEPTARGFLHAVSNFAATPGGGSVAAYAGALGAALVRMVAGLSLPAELREPGELADGITDNPTHERLVRVANAAEQLVARLADLTQRDAAAYDAVVRAYRLPKDAGADMQLRDAAIRSALLHAARVPLETARLCAQAAELANLVATHGARHAISDAGVAALMADAACKGAAYNVRVNLTQLSGAEADELAVAALRAVEDATVHTTATTRAVEAALARPAI